MPLVFAQYHRALIKSPQVTPLKNAYRRSAYRYCFIQSKYDRYFFNVESELIIKMETKSSSSRCGIRTPSLLSDSKVAEHGV